MIDKKGWAAMKAILSELYNDGPKAANDWFKSTIITPMKPMTIR